MFKWAVTLLLFSAPLFAQSKIETAANFGIRAADAAQTCYHLNTNPYWRERFLTTQSCAAVAGISAGFAVGSFGVDRWLLKHHHARLAHFQIASAAGAGFGIAYTFTRKR